MLKPYLRSPVAPWSGLIASPVAWLLHHQGVSDTVYFDCTSGNPATTLAVGLLALLVLAASAWLSWAARRSPDPEVEAQARYFLSLMSVLLCALFAIAVVLQIMAGVIIPGCAR